MSGEKWHTRSRPGYLHCVRCFVVSWSNPMTRSEKVQHFRELTPVNLLGKYFKCLMSSEQTPQDTVSEMSTGCSCNWVTKNPWPFLAGPPFCFWRFGDNTSNPKKSNRKTSKGIKHRKHKTSKVANLQQQLGIVFQSLGIKRRMPKNHKGQNVELIILPEDSKKFSFPSHSLLSILSFRSFVPSTFYPSNVLIFEVCLSMFCHPTVWQVPHRVR